MLPHMYSLDIAAIVWYGDTLADLTQRIQQAAMSFNMQPIRRTVSGSYIW